MKPVYSVSYWGGISPCLNLKCMRWTAPVYNMMNTDNGKKTVDSLLMKSIRVYHSCSQIISYWIDRSMFHCMFVTSTSVTSQNFIILVLRGIMKPTTQIVLVSIGDEGNVFQHRHTFSYWLLNVSSSSSLTMVMVDLFLIYARKQFSSLPLFSLT